MDPMCFKTIVLIIALCALASCGILFSGANGPIAKECFFEPVSRSIVYKGKHSDGIKRIEIELVPTENKSRSPYFERNYFLPAQRINLSFVDTILLTQKNLQIKIWDSSPVIEDYDLVIKPSDWQRRKLVYSRYSAR